ncbi:MAG: hypothetical protein M3P04_10825, partial [Actinomycetota bacterium]|nr:hypothetical protein [Actinomycetota bacterium]
MSALALVIGSVGVVLTTSSPAGAKSSVQSATYLVLYANGASNASGRAAVQMAGGTVTHENRAVGLAEVTSSNPQFLRDVRRQAAVKGASRDSSIGTARPGMGHKFRDEILTDERATATPHSGSGP